MALFASSDVDATLQDAEHFTKHIAGAELNVAVGLARLGLNIDYISQVGSDQFGDYLLSEAKAAKIGISHFYKTPDFRTGIYFKELISKGDPNVLYYRKDSAAANFKAELLDRVNFSEYSFAHLSGIFPAISHNCADIFAELLVRLNDNDVSITYDPNLRPTLWESEDIMRDALNNYAKSARVILPGINEGEILCGTREASEIADFYLNQSEKTELVVVKLGSDGAYYKSSDGQEDTVQGFKVDKVVDTVGAGDGFSVGFISGLMDGLDIADCVKRACYIGARAVTVAGDSDGYPTREELENFTF